MRWLALAFGVAACGVAQAPPTRENVIVSGTAYNRGLAHGTQLTSKIHSFYTTLLTASLLPYLGREQADIETLLPIYASAKYANGQFAYQLMLDSAHSVEHSLSQDQRDELRGVSDGSGLSYDDTLVLNTFVDTLLAVRGVALAIRLSRAPQLTAISVDSQSLDPYVPVPGAAFVEVSPSPVFDITLKDPDGIDPASIRIEMDGAVYGVNHVSLFAFDGGMNVRVATGDLGPPAAHTLVISASDTVQSDNPPPVHENVMRDEEILFTTLGTGLDSGDVLRPTLNDNRTRPPPIAFALRGERTANGQTLLAQNFALLDANTAHEHTIVLEQHPDVGPSFATVGWAGLIYGFSGVSENGVGAVCNPSDTLNNSIVGSVLGQIADLSTATLVATGKPIGFALRDVLSTATDATSAAATMQSISHVYGWNCVFADADGGIQGIEVNSGAFSLPPVTEPLAPVQDALVASSAYQVLVDDAPLLTLAGEHIVPQRYWSGFFYRSVRVADAVHRRLTPAMTVEQVEDLLAVDELVDQSDSMNAVVIEPAARRISSAMGQEPATAGPSETLELTP